MSHALGCTYPKGCNCGQSAWDSVNFKLASCRDEIVSLTKQRDDARLRAEALDNKLDQRYKENLQLRVKFDEQKEFLKKMAGALISCMKVSGISMHPEILDATGEGKLSKVDKETWVVLKKAGYLNE